MEKKSVYDLTYTFDEKADDLGIIALEGTEELAKKIDWYLVSWFNTFAKATGLPEKDTFLIENTCPRFTSGDGKGMILSTVRDKDLYILVDVGNYSVSYNMFGQKVMMSPDDHYANLKRIILAVGGKAKKITVIMPILYGGRQHRRIFRESLDCAWMLQELESMGVADIITFDAHDPRVQNAIPLTGFDNFLPTYQILKALLRKFPDLSINKNNFMVVSPDEGAISRNIYYASMLSVDLGMFFKRRDYTTIVDGRNPIIAHEYIGSSVMGIDVFVNDDIIATGDSILKLAKELKEFGANRIFISSTFALFTEGLEKFDKAFKEGYFDAVVSTNLTYNRPDLEEKEWFVKADLSKFISYIILAANQHKSFSVLLDPHEKIQNLIDNYKK